MKAEFVLHPAYTAIAMAYRNGALIADDVLPRVGVNAPIFSWMKYDLGNNYQIIDSKVDRRSKPNEVDWQGTEDQAMVEDYALDAPLPRRDVMIYDANTASGAPAPRDIRGLKVEQITDMLLLGREKRVADMVFDAANYGSGNKATLSGTSQWSHASSDPIDAILAALDSMMIRPNKMVLGQAVWTKLRQHAKVTAALLPAGGNADIRGGVAARAALADLLEIDEILVGRSYANTAKPGQAVSLSRVWGKDALFYYQAPVLTGAEGTVTFGFTAEWGGRISGTISDPDMGARGGERMRVGESVKELLTAPDAAYLFKAAVA